MDKSCSNVEAHIRVLRNIADKLSADALAEDTASELHNPISTSNCTHLVKADPLHVHFMHGLLDEMEQV